MRSLASLKLTLLGMCLLGTGALYAYDRPDASFLWIAGPLLLLSLNLLAAIWADARFRSQPPLLAFHICLLVIVLLAAAGRLMRLDGRVEIAEGQGFDAERVEVTARGPWQHSDLDGVSFRQGQITVDYAPRLYRDGTRSRVWRTDSAGRMRGEIVGDDRPLVIDGYRFYTTSNKGWAILLTWQEEDGAAEHGVVHLPSYPFLVRKQRNQWRLPTGEEVEFSLGLEEVSQNAAWRLESDGMDAVVSVRVGDRLERLAPGQSIALVGGQLRYEELRMWMGYRISYDPTVPWIAAAAVAAVGFMVWHFWLALWSAPLPRPELEPLAVEV